MKKFERNKYPLVLMSTKVYGLGAQAGGAIVLRDHGVGGHRLVVHFYNEQDGGYHQGDYFRGDEYEKAVAKFEERSRQYTNHHTRLREGVFNVDIPEYGDKMTVPDFLESVADGYFTDFDGDGRWSDGEKMEDVKLHTVTEQPPLNATHVVWFNK